MVQLEPQEDGQGQVQCPPAAPKPPYWCDWDSQEMCERDPSAPSTPNPLCWCNWDPTGMLEGGSQFPPALPETRYWWHWDTSGPGGGGGGVHSAPSIPQCSQYPATGLGKQTRPRLGAAVYGWQRQCNKDSLRPY